MFDRLLTKAPSAMRRTIGGRTTGSLFDVVDEYRREDRPR
jgi:hypothetical protein